MQKPDSVPTAGGCSKSSRSTMLAGARHGAQVVYVDPVGGRRATGPRASLRHPHHARARRHFDTATLEELVGTKAVPMVVSRGVYEKLPAALKALARAVGYGDRADLNGVPVRVVQACNTTPERLRYHPKGLGNGYVLTFSVPASIRGGT